MAVPHGKRSKVVPKDRAAQFAMHLARQAFDIAANARIGDGRNSAFMVRKYNNLIRRFEANAWSLDQTDGNRLRKPPVKTRTGREEARALPPVTP
jgi:uncharacterized membrane protein YccC